MTLDLKQKLADKRQTIGSWLSLPSVNVAEVMARLGKFEWLVVDMEHTNISTETMGQMIQVIDLCGVTPLVRVGDNDPLLIKRALDCGAGGIIVPQVNSRAQAEAAVEAVYYPPKGKRGVGLFRAQNYGAGFDTYVRQQAGRVALIVQIEHKDAVADLEAIMAVDGVDAFMVGPYDLTGSFNRLGDLEDKDVKAALERVSDYCRKGEKAGGIHVVHPDETVLTQRLGENYKFIAYGTDMVFFGEKINSVNTTLARIRSGEGA